MTAPRVSSGFSKAARLRQRAEFDFVFSAPEQRSGDRYFTVLGRRRVGGQAKARLGMVVAKRHLPRANQRNRVKRIIRESFRQYDFPHCPIDLIVLVKPAVSGANNRALFNALNRHWLKVTS